MNVWPEIVRQIDELTKADLQGLRDWYFLWLLVSSGVVAVGVALEGPEVVHDTLGLIRRSSKPECRTPPWIKWLALVGWIFIVFGVAGEGMAEGLVSWADGLTQTFNDILLTDAQHESALAWSRASKAISDAGSANERASENERKAARLEKEAEAEKLARVKLEALIQPRDLQDPWVLTYACRPFPGHPVQVVSYAMDAEAWRLSQQIIKAFWNCNIFPQDMTSSVMRLGGFETGVSVNGTESEKQLTYAIRGALGLENLIPQNAPVSKLSSQGQMVIILVGVKPLP